MRRCWVFLLLLVSCSDTGKYRLNLVFDHPDVVEVEVWVLDPSDKTCDDYLTYTANPGGAAVLSSVVIPVPAEGAETLGDVPSGEALFVAEGRTAAGAKILRGCTRYEVRGGANNYITIELTQVCWPETEDLQNQQDDDCDMKIDECDADADCDDSDNCTIDTCVQEACEHNAVDCSNLNGPCVDGECDPASGDCVSTPKSDGTGCDDGNDCTDTDTCTGGACAGTPIPNCCTGPQHCSDGQDCTDDVCDVPSGICSNPVMAGQCYIANVCYTDGEPNPANGCQECVATTSNDAWTNNTAACNDGLYCTESDQCADGNCAGTARDCGDGDDCTIDTCDDDLDECINTLDPRPGDEGLSVGNTCSNSVDDDCDGLTDTDDVDDCLPKPVRSKGQPTGVLPSTTRVATLSLDTDMGCTCRYDVAAGTDYDSMTGSFTTTGGMQHSVLLIGLEHGTTYDYHVRCRDPLRATNDDDYTISFVVSNLPTPIYRSVGPRNNTALANGSGNALTVVNSTATFTWPLPDNVGVGDVIQYDSDDDGAVDALAFIYTRLSGSEFRVKDFAGAGPAATQAGDEDWSVLRAYTSLDNAEDATENTGFDDSLQDFDTWTLGRDLVTSNEVWNIACYADAPDSARLIISNWVTAPANYLKIYTPVEAWEVGATQRHDGKWSTNAYRMTYSPTADYHRIMRITSDYTVVDGLQFYLYTEWTGTFCVQHDADDGEFWLSNCIMRGDTDRELGWYGGVLVESVNSVVRIWNNVIYDFDEFAAADGYGIRISDPTVEGYLYNNTIYDADACYAGNLLNTVLKNNIAQSCNNGYASWNGENGSTDYNISNRAGDFPGANSINDATVLFVNEAGDDFHLDPADTTAVDVGTDLSGDPVIPFSDDIDGDLRSGAWDIGADEL
jgi:hypothetical protein